MADLRALVADELGRPVDPAVKELATKVADRFGPASLAVLFYGSCLRAHSVDGLMLDFYVVVDDYALAYGRGVRGRFLAWANRLLPPNVFQIAVAGQRAKYAVLSLADLGRLASTATRNPSVWARFAQPSRIVWALDAAAWQATVEAVAQSAPTLLAAAVPLSGRTSTLRDLWTGVFAQTYATELRSERVGRGLTLFDSDPDWYRAITAPALAAAGVAARIDGDAVHFEDVADVAGAARQWRRRRIEGKLLSAARLIKASTTFDGGLDYLAWKITRHSGVIVTVAPWQRRFPLLGALVLLPRLLARGAVR